jgi:hypothetical protein
MIIKSLLFIIVCIFVYETYNTLTKMTEEYFINLNPNNEKFVSLGEDLEKNDIAKTIAINCKEWPSKVSRIMTNKEPNVETLDTPYYARFKPLAFNPNRKYYWNPHKLVNEGKRRSKDDENEIEAIKVKFDNENDPDKKQILQDELNLYKWRENILALKDKETNLDRDMRDITTDYYPDEIGLVRPWIEIHSHIPDYSY